ncbi:MAG TPA: hypothetical protein VG755_41770 [Nannocystaceae bacterium]|nr:hypothetical protein [Nannocystaceae bacterium]
MPKPTAAVHALEAYLRRCDRAPFPEPDEVLALSHAEQAVLVVEVVRRRVADGGHGPGPYFALEKVEGAILEGVPELPLPQLCTLLRTLGGAQGLCGYYWKAAWMHAQQQIARAGIAPELHDALRAMQPAMACHTADKNARERIDLVLWFEQHLPIDPSRDATAVIKRDLRAMSAKLRTTWTKLLEHAQSCDRGEPNATWLTKADKHRERVGRDALHDRTLGWLRELDAMPGQPTLAPGGVDALRGLLFFATLVRSDELDAVIRRLAARRWSRSRDWSPRHDRFVGALAYALGRASRDAATRATLEALQRSFGRTTAKYAIANALAT